MCCPSGTLELTLPLQISLAVTVLCLSQGSPAVTFLGQRVCVLPTAVLCGITGHM